MKTQSRKNKKILTKEERTERIEKVCVIAYFSIALILNLWFAHVVLN